MAQTRTPRRHSGVTTNLNQQYTWDSVRLAASGRWEIILPALGVQDQFLRRRHGPCPACGGRDRFRFDDKNGSGSFYCSHCGAGDGFKLIQIVYDLATQESLQLVAGALGLDRGPVNLPPIASKSAASDSADENAANRQRYLRRLWNRSVPVESSDPVDTYLRKTRRLELLAMPSEIRYCEQLEYREEEKPGVWVTTGVFPAMIARILSPSGALVGLHRTYLTIDGKKAPVTSPRKLTVAFPMATKGAAIKLQPVGITLGVAEGMETALACHIATGLPIWSTISAGGLASLVVPDIVQELIVFADNDRSGTGEKAARTLARRMLAEGRKVKIIKPQIVGTDWADNLQV